MRRLLSLLLVGGLVALASGSIDPQQFECEEAVAHLDDCCNAQVDVHCGDGCNSVELTLDNAVCLRKASCDALIRSGACDDPKSATCE
jgi:hypothetical protein